MYNFREIEKKWQEYWEKNQTFKTDIWDFSKPKYYALDMFPYPSGVGLHAGHPEGYTATDVVSRMKRMQGYNVLHPMGWDAFGLPAEQFAIKTGNHPSGFTAKNIETFKSQLKMLGFSYDWGRELSTSDPKFYKWTQWIFKKLYEDGLARCVDMPVNWCEELGTVLANDEIIDGKSERGGYPVVKKNMKQWVIDIPKYAEKLLDGLEKLDWPESTKEMQRNWIGKSIGAVVTFSIKNENQTFDVFTTRCDTLFGATYCVLSPEHQLVSRITTPEKKKEVEEYKKACSAKSELERTELNKEKTGVFTGAYAINPVNNEEIPIWISDYVLVTYGTGAIMAVPAHDTRDYEFAKKFHIPIKQVLAKTFEGIKSEAVRDNVPFVSGKRVNLIIKHPTEEKYLCTTNKELTQFSFLMNELKKDETPIMTANRTLLEQTGYDDVRKFTSLEFVYFEDFYDSAKEMNRHITSYTIVATLNSLHQIEQKLNEENSNNLIWIEKDNLLDSLSKEAQKYDLRRILEGESAYIEDGTHIHSQFLDGLDKVEAIEKMLTWLEKNNCGKKKVNYRLRDWIFARQRYWGEPIPIIHLENGEDVALRDDELPLVLPELSDYSPSKTGSSPLEKAENWVLVDVDGRKGKRETSTMPGSAGSSWYYLRYIDPDNEKELADPELIQHWMPVDLYVGGPEHAVGHLLYSRMWNHYLYDKGISSVQEPFQKLVHQGMILGENGVKMGKRFPDYAVDPRDIAMKYGADTLRLYEMFMGPLEADKPWSSQGVEGAKRFLDRIWRLYQNEEKIKKQKNPNLEKVYHQTVKKVTEDYESLNFNTAISQMMIFINMVYKEEVFPYEYAINFLKLLNPIAPHITEELWNLMGNENTISYEKWPRYDLKKTIDDEIEIAVQVNGKVRCVIHIAKDEEEETVKKKALSNENVKRNIEGKEMIKMIVVPNRIVNIVTK